MTIGSHQRSIGKSQVHITPRWIIDRLGPFDLDPCAAWPRPWACAELNITEEQDGLSIEWTGRVWLNPPFHRHHVKAWVERLARHGDGIALLHARTETAWFEPIWACAHSLMFLAGRLIFCRPDGHHQTISDPASKHYGKAANSGAPVVLVAFGQHNTARLRSSGIAGYHVTEWERSVCERSAA